MKELEEIGKLIRAIARKRAEAIVKKLVDVIGDNADLLNLLEEYKVTVNKEGKLSSIRSAFWSTSSELPTQLIKDLTEKYISEEAKAFIKDVDDIKDELRKYGERNSND